MTARTTLKRPNTNPYIENVGPAEKIHIGLATQARDRTGFSHAQSELDAGKGLYDHFRSLKEDMEALAVAKYLQERGVLDTSSYRNILHVKTRRNRVDALLKALHAVMRQDVCAGNVETYRLFLAALSETGQDEIVTLLETPVTIHRPQKAEIEKLWRIFTTRKNEILSEVEPLDVIDDIMVYRGLHFHDHDEIMQAKSRKTRVDLLHRHLQSSGKSDVWRILKPMSEKYKKLFSETVRLGTSSSPVPPDSSAPTASAFGASVSAVSSEPETPSMALSLSFTDARKCSVAVSDTNEHDHPEVIKSKIRELEKRIVDDVNNDNEKTNADLTKLMDDCTSSFKKLTFSCIKLHLQAFSDTSVEQLKECCQNGRVKTWILSMLDDQTVEELKELGATSADLEIYVDERKDFLHIFDEVKEGCLCTLNKEVLESQRSYIVEKVEHLEVSFIDKVLKSSILPKEQAKNFLKIKECIDETERRQRLVDYLVKENTCQTTFCLLEEAMMMNGKAEAIIRLRQTKPCKISSDLKNTISQEKLIITVSDVREHSAMLEEEIDARWFQSSLESRSDPKSLEMLNKIRNSKSRTERTKPFMEYLYEQNDLKWFEEGLEKHQTHILDFLKQVPEKCHTKDLKLAFMSAYDTVVEDIEPLSLVKYMSSSVLEKIDMAYLIGISSRQQRAAFFIRKVLGGDDQTVTEFLEAMRNSYGDVVRTIEEIMESGSLTEKYKCPRLRRLHGKSPECVFKTNISLFGQTDNKSSDREDEPYCLEGLKQIRIAPGFVEAEIVKYDKTIKHEKDIHWASYDRYITNIGVIGAQNACKDSLLRALCGRIETDEETAPIYVETNMKRFGSYKEARNVLFWNLPEIGSEQFPRETYLRDIDFKRYDCFILLVSGKITIDNNILIVRELAHLHRKVLLVSASKTETLLSRYGDLQPIPHCSSATTVIEKQIVETARQNYYQELKKSGCTEATVFLINEDEIHNSDYDFDKLIIKLNEEVAENKHPQSELE